MTLLRWLFVVAVVAVLLGAGRDLVASGPGELGATSKSAEADNPVSKVRPGSADCQRRPRPVRVVLSVKRWPRIADHVSDVARRYPAVLHLDRRHADEHRDASLRGIRTAPGYDRDEYPPAVSREGGKGADVRLVRSSENRSAGAAMGARLRPFCDGQRFRLVVRR